MEKRGLSNIIATVLIVLLALAAVGIIWGFLREPLEQSSLSVALQSKCFTVEAKPLSCKFDGVSVNFTIQLVRGEVVEVLGVVELEDGSFIVNRTVAPNQLATVSFKNGYDSTPLRLRGTVVVADDGDGSNTLVCAESIGIDCRNVSTGG